MPQPRAEAFLRLLARRGTMEYDELARRLDISSGVLAHTGRRLEQMGLLRREKDSDKARRTRRFVITEAGRAAIRG